jgi:hypothetical protein
MELSDAELTSEAVTRIFALWGVEPIPIWFENKILAIKLYLQIEFLFNGNENKIQKWLLEDNPNFPPTPLQYISTVEGMSRLELLLSSRRIPIDYGYL